MERGEKSVISFIMPCPKIDLFSGADEGFRAADWEPAIAMVRVKQGVLEYPTGTVQYPDQQLLCPPGNVVEIGAASILKQINK